MLAAISTTILSRRSWAETCSAMVSRSRLNKTRGPPDALRMSPQSPPSAGPERGSGGSPENPEKQQIAHPAPAQAISNTIACAESAPPQLGLSFWQPTLSPYSESGLVLPSKTPARGEGVYTFAFAAAAKRKFV